MAKPKYVDPPVRKETTESENEIRQDYWGRPLKPVRRPEVSRRGWQHPLAPIVIIILFALGAVVALLSRQARMQLLSEPPGAFVAPLPEWQAPRRQAEQRLARAYWACVVNGLQFRYSYGSALPEVAPEEFRINPMTLPDRSVATEQARDFYWQRLRKLWPYAWRRIYVWDTNWWPRFLQYLDERLPKLL